VGVTSLTDAVRICWTTFGAPRVELRVKLIAAGYLQTNEIAIVASAMAISAHRCRENANACAWCAEQPRHPFTKAAYKEMVRAWFILAAGAEQLVESSAQEHVLAA
jgi:hypothetical protein